MGFVLLALCKYGWALGVEKQGVKDMGVCVLLEYCENIKSFFFIDKNVKLNHLGSSAHDNPHIQRMLARAERESESLSGGHGMLRMLEHFIREDDLLDNDQSMQENILFLVEDSLKNMEESWADVSSSYARLRINYLLSKQI